MAVRQPFVLALTGSSLTTGRLAAPPDGFRATLLRDLQEQPEAKGPIRVYDLGHGGWTSQDLLNNAPLISALKPTHILAEGGAINDCFDSGGGPTISRAQHITNNIAMITEWKTNTPASLITLQTMSSVDAIVATARTQLANYYADEIATAVAQSIGHIDNYPSWPAPLSTILTNGTVPRTYPLPAGYSEWAFNGLFFDPANKNAHIALSGANQIATATDPAQSAARALTSRNAGKGCFEVSVLANSGAGSIGIGIATAAASLADGSYVGFDAFGYGYRNSGLVYNNAIATGGVVGYTVGDFIDIAVDSGASKVWFAKNGVWQNGDPAAGTGGMAITAGVYFPAVSLTNTASVEIYPIGGDGLHPLWTGAFGTYSYPAILAYIRAQMAAFWP